MKNLLNKKNKMDGLELLDHIDDDTIRLCFFDPQYKGILDKLNYGENGRRQKERYDLPQMSDDIIIEFIQEIDRVLIPSSYLMIWMDKFHLTEGFGNWVENTNLKVVDMITWDKSKIGMGYRSRRRSEYLVIFQKRPIKAKSTWKRHDIPDVWCEKIKPNHPHSKPHGLQKALIDAVTNENDIVLDPASGGWSVFECCKDLGIDFIGSDLVFGDD